jgi:hypothetical protein
LVIGGAAEPGPHPALGIKSERRSRLRVDGCRQAYSPATSQNMNGLWRNPGSARNFRIDRHEIIVAVELQAEP